MSDLVKYLRAHVAADRPCKRSEQDLACGRAADELDRLNARLAEAERILRRLRFLRVECITHKDNELMDDWREFLRPADSASAQEDIGQ